MKHRNKLIEIKRHAKARWTTLTKRYFEIPEYFYPITDMSCLMGDIDLGHHAWDRDGICLLKEDYKKIAYIPFNRLIAYAGRLEKNDVRIFAGSLKVGLARRWVAGRFSLNQV